MQYIRQGATHKVVIGPAVAVGDGFTPVTTLAVSSADEAEAILHDNGTVVDISGYTFAAITTADGYYHLTLQSGISNTVGHLTIVINDDSLILPIRQDFCVVEEAVYDAMFAASAPGFATVAASTAIEADTQDIQSRLPAALVNSRMDCTIDGTGMETGAVDNILNRDASASTTNSTLGAIINDWENGGRLDSIVDDILTDTGTTLQAELDGIQADTEDIQTRLPAALVGGRIDATVDGTGMESGAINAIIEACFTYDATATYATADAGSLVAQIADNAGGSGLTAGAIADAVWDEDLTGHTTPDSAGEILGNVATGTPPTAAAIADAVWDEATAGHTTSGTFGEQLKTDVDAILADTNELQTDDYPTTLATLATAAELAKVPKSDGTATWNATALASIQQEATDALNAYDPPTNAEMEARTLAAADYATNTDLDALITTVGVAGAGLTEAGGTGDHLTAVVVASLAAQAKADVNAEVLDVLNVDTFAEPTGVPGATTTLRNMLGFVYSFGFRNKITVDASKMTFFGDDDAAEFEKDVSDDGTTYTESEANSV